jgi:hypothetical protein
MVKPDPIERALERLGELRHGEPSEHAAEEVRGYLCNRSNLVISKAAKVARDLRLIALLPDIVAAFDKLMTNAAKLDKRCAAVTELMSALYEMDYVEPEPYLKGLKHVQLEGSYGPPVDEAARLRGLSAQGLLRTRYADALPEVVSMLVDPEPAAREGAIRALATNGGDAGALLLRLKVLTGDREASVIGECFAGLLASSGEKAMGFVAPYLDAGDDAIAEAAMLALGESRLLPGFEALREKWERTVAIDMRRTLLAAIAASRLDEAVEFLVAVVESSGAAIAAEAVEALSIYRNNERVVERLRGAVAQRKERNLADRFRATFG